jgi:hypothetical protein
MRFAGELSDEQRDTISTAMDGLSTKRLSTRNVVDDTVDIEWSGGQLRVTGPRIATHSSRSGEAISEVYGNGDVHRWVRRFLAKGAVPLHARFPLDEVSVSVREY